MRRPPERPDTRRVSNPWPATDVPAREPADFITRSAVDPGGNRGGEDRVVRGIGQSRRELAAAASGSRDHRPMAIARTSGDACPPPVFASPAPRLPRRRDHRTSATRGIWRRLKASSVSGPRSAADRHAQQAPGGAVQDRSGTRRGQVNVTRGFPPRFPWLPRHRPRPRNTAPA